MEAMINRPADLGCREIAITEKPNITITEKNNARLMENGIDIINAIEEQINKGLLMYFCGESQK